MNDYRVYYLDAQGTQRETLLTGPSEKAVRRIFVDSCKARKDDTNILQIFLIKENTSATKQQERDALQKIKKIVSELGPESYIGAAFEGVLEDAEDNIDDDAMYSMKSRWESAENRLLDALDKIRSLNAIIQQMDSTVAGYRSEIEKLKHDVEMIPSELSLVDHQTLISRKIDKIKSDLVQTSKEIVRHAEDPSSQAFQLAVKVHKKLTIELEQFKEWHRNISELLD